MPRPTKLNSAVQDKIVNYLTQGVTIENLCEVIVTGDDIGIYFQLKVKTVIGGVTTTNNANFATPTSCRFQPAQPARIWGSG